MFLVVSLSFPLQKKGDGAEERGNTNASFGSSMVIVVLLNQRHGWSSSLEGPSSWGVVDTSAPAIGIGGHTWIVRICSSRIGIPSSDHVLWHGMMHLVESHIHKGSTITSSQIVGTRCVITTGRSICQ